jgi:hypothetical protein
MLKIINQEIILTAVTRPKNKKRETEREGGRKRDRDRDREGRR